MGSRPGDPASGGLTFQDYLKNEALPKDLGGYSFDPQGRFLYAINNGNLWGYSVDGKGALQFLGILASWTPRAS